MKKLQQTIYILGGILLVAGAALYITRWAWVPYMYTIGAFMFGAMQMLDRYTGRNLVLRRLRRQHNEWIVCLLVGCLVELYTAFRIPQEYEKENS